jgi:hypothetical protein
MNEAKIEKTFANLLIIGSALVSLFLLTGSVTDPVNAPKMFICGSLGFGSLSLLLVFKLRETWERFRIFLAVSFSFIVFMCWAVFRSHSPIEQNLYGVYGRNTGLVTYLALTFIYLGALQLRTRESFNKLIYSFGVTGLINVVYCTWVLLFGDFIPWNNLYKKILGTFGNPDFISAFLGIFVSILVVNLLSEKFNIRKKIILILLIGIAFYEIVLSHAIQGIALSACGAAVAGFYFLRSKYKSSLLVPGYVLLVGLTALVGVLGALQKGPLAFIYKVSVSLRGEYWRAGLSMGSAHPLSGVGMDSYGDWYRRTRSEHAATVLPGPKVFTNVAHNVFIDIFSYGGWPLLVSYLLLFFLTIIAVFRVSRRTVNYDPIFVSMVAAWICYEIQSVISINQIGIAIWGWLLKGAIVAYEFSTREDSADEPDQNKVTYKKSPTPTLEIFSPQLVCGLGIVVGALVSVPPLSGDMDWVAAVKSRDVSRVIKTVTPNYLNPRDSHKYSQTARLLASNNLLTQSLEVILEATKYNQDDFDSWALLYSHPDATAEQKARALMNMKRLDPRNPDVTATQ